MGAGLSGRVMAKTGEECFQRGMEADNAGDYHLALKLWFHGISEFANPRCSAHVYFAAERAERLTSDQRRKLVIRAERGHAASMYIVGYMKRTGFCGFAIDSHAAFQMFRDAAALGHVYAMYARAICVNYGVGVEDDEGGQDELAASELLREAAARGCAAACREVAKRHQSGAHGCSRDLFRAGRYYCAGVRLGSDYCTHYLQEMMEEHPHAWTLGSWAPDVHPMFPDRVHREAKTFLLVCKRGGDAAIPLNKHVRSMVLSYILTPGSRD